MEHPKDQVSHVIRMLTEGSPVQQRDAIELYFKPDASLIHPLCRVPSFSRVTFPFLWDINSRWVISLIYRWYKILSPQIIIHIDSIEHEQKSNTIYCELRQEFSKIFVPFYRNSAHLTTKLILHYEEHEGKYYIKTQEDLYQPDQLIRYFFPGGSALILLFQYFAAYFCVIGALILAPITWFEQKISEGEKQVNGVGKHN